ncbi:MAG: formylglycine-generating enzyme family protein [Planctomycetota bacterium]|jgi:formylglycine-generating enzyme required for sulfatase activity
MIMSRTLAHVAIAAIWAAVTTTPDAGAAQNETPNKYTETITANTDEKVSFDMVLIPAGSFQMGSAADEAGRKDDEGPKHEVRLDSFYLCTTETTIALFMAYYQETVSAKRDLLGVQEEKKEGDGDVDAITGPTPVYGDMTMGYSKKHPAMGMTWHSAMTFCRWLCFKTGKPYRLPTEAEWEYACRAGTTSALGVARAAEQMKEFAWYEATADSETSEVGKKKPNAWGLYDMPGNVREWVYDFYSPAAYEQAAKQTPSVNPKGPDAGEVHVARGGDYSSPVEELRCAARAFEETWWRSGDPQIPKSKWWLPQMDIIGFRVARSLEADGKK